MRAANADSEALARLNRIGIALSSERDLPRLLAAILREARTFTGAEAGTLYGVEAGGLRFLAVQNEALLPAVSQANRAGSHVRAGGDCSPWLDDRLSHECESRFVPQPAVDATAAQASGLLSHAADFLPEPSELLPLTRASMAGYVGVTGEVINIPDVYDPPPGLPYRFNPDFDRRTGYRSRSMLLAPLKDPGGAVLGVLQLINARDAVGRIVAFDDQTTDLVLSLASQAAVALRNAQLAAELKAAYLDTVLRLAAAAEYKDPDTAQHIRRMAEYSAIVAEGLGWSAEDVELLRCAAPMHDIGKIAIPEAILRKPGKLTSEEIEQMKQHTTLGARLFEGATAPVLRMSATIALTHHERHDGQGYPQGLAAEAIPMAGRVVAIADVFDALSSPRCYKPSFSLEHCVQTIQQGAGTQFHPQVVAAFTRRLDRILEIRSRFAE